MLKLKSKINSRSNLIAAMNSEMRLVNKEIIPRKWSVGLKKLERSVLSFVCAINYVLVPIAKFALPIVGGYAGFFGGAALGATGDTALAGASLGLIAITGGAIGGTLGAFAGKMAAGLYGRVDKLLRNRLDLLNKELAVHTGHDLVFSKFLKIV